MSDIKTPIYSEITAAAKRAKLLVRGGFHPISDDAVPPLAGGRPARTVLLLGNSGPHLWSSASTRLMADRASDPLDSWTEATVSAIAEAYGADPLFPFSGPPFLPFLRWAQRAEPVAPSAIGILIHPRYGLWHAYRAALAFADRLTLPPREDEAHPCDSCVEQPCLSTCPVGAFSTDGYDVDTCAAHIGSPAGRACLETGCIARHACPIGREYVYAPDQARFHMAAFLAARDR